MEEELRVLIVDDEAVCSDQLEDRLKDFSFVKVIKVLRSSNGYEETLQSEQIDLVFLDICIDRESGFHLAEFTHQKFPDKMIIFTTGFDDYAKEGYEFEPLDFIMKPVDKDRLGRALKRAMDKKRQKNEQRKGQEGVKIALSLKGGMRFVCVSSILYAERIRRKCHIFFYESDQLTELELNQSMTEMEQILSEYGFMRVHQSFIIPMNRIRMIQGASIGSSYELYLEGLDKPIPVSRKMYKPLTESMKNQFTTK